MLVCSIFRYSAISFGPLKSSRAMKREGGMLLKLIKLGKIFKKNIQSKKIVKLSKQFLTRLHRSSFSWRLECLGCRFWRIASPWCSLCRPKIKRSINWKNLIRPYSQWRHRRGSFRIWSYTDPRSSRDFCLLCHSRISQRILRRCICKTTTIWKFLSDPPIHS